MSTILDTFSMKQVARFVDGLTKLSNDTGVTIFAEQANAQIRLGDEPTGLSLVDGNFDDDGYQVEVQGA